MKANLDAPSQALLEEARRLDALDLRAPAIAAYRELAFGPASAGLPAGMRESIVAVLIQRLRAAGDAEGSLDAFVQARTLLPECEAQFDDIYLAGLRASGASPYPFQRRERFFELTRYLRRTEGMAGDVVECGTGSGLSSYLLCSYLHLESESFRGRGYRAFDSFEGLSEPQPEDEVAPEHPQAAHLARQMRAGNFGAPLARLRQVLASFPEVDYHPGWIPASLQGMPERLYRFVHIDVDLYAPTLGALEYFYPRLADGGMIVSDDFGWPGCEKAMRGFSLEVGAELDINAHGQACLTAPC